jgi:hypothetical protein
MGDISVCYTRIYRNGRGTLQDHLRRRGEGQLEEPDYRTPFLVSLEQSRRAAVTTANHLPSYEYTTTPFTQRPCRSTAAGASLMSQRQPAQRPVYTAPTFTQLSSQQLATQRDNYSKGNSYRDETEEAER